MQQVSTGLPPPVLDYHRLPSAAREGDAYSGTAQYGTELRCAPLTACARAFSTAAQLTSMPSPRHPACLQQASSTRPASSVCLVTLRIIHARWQQAQELAGRDQGEDATTVYKIDSSITAHCMDLPERPQVRRRGRSYRHVSGTTRRTMGRTCTTCLTMCTLRVITIARTVMTAQVYHHVI